MSFLHDFNGLAQKPIRQKGNAEAKKIRRCPPCVSKTFQNPLNPLYAVQHFPILRPLNPITPFGAIADFYS